MREKIIKIKTNPKKFGIVLSELPKLKKVDYLDRLIIQITDLS